MKTYKVQITFQHPYHVSQTVSLTVMVIANNDEEAHILAYSELEHSLGQSLVIYETITI